MRNAQVLPALQAIPARKRLWIRQWRLAGQDLIRCLKSWHIWALLGVSDVRLRYKRSRFGQLCITCSMTFCVCDIGAVCGGLFYQDVHEYFPYLAVNMMIWTLMQTTIEESGQAFIEAAHDRRQEALPKSTFMMRHPLALAHAVIVIPLVIITVADRPTFAAVLAFPGLLLGMAGVFLALICLALLCTRFRDMPQIVGNLLLLASVTPIMCHVEQLGSNAISIAVFDLFAAFRCVVSKPLLGDVAIRRSYGTAFVALGTLALIAWPSFAKFRARIV